MKKVIIAVSLLLTGALLITPITTNASSSKNDSEPVKVEQVSSTQKTQTKNEATTTKNEVITHVAPKTEVQVTQAKAENTDKSQLNSQQPTKEETKKEETSNEAITEDKVAQDKVEQEQEEVVENTGMSKAQAEAILNKYIKNVEQADYTYTYKGDENTYKVIKNKGIRGYVFLPNIETDLAFLVDKDNGSIYYFHPSGYFEQLQ